MKQPVTDFSYTLVPTEGDVRDAKITKAGLKAEFTLHDVYVDYDGLKKRLVEQEGQAKVSGAEAKNIEENHPFVLTLSRQDLFTAALYFEITKRVHTAEEAVKALTEALADYDKEIQKIHEDLKLPTRHEMEVADREKFAAEEAAKQPAVEAAPVAETPAEPQA